MQKKALTPADVKALHKKSLKVIVVIIRNQTCRKFLKLMFEISFQRLTATQPLQGHCRRVF